MKTGAEHVLNFWKNHDSQAIAQHCCKIALGAVCYVAFIWVPLPHRAKMKLLPWAGFYGYQESPKWIPMNDRRRIA